MNHAALTKAMHTRGAFIIAAIIAAIGTALAYLMADHTDVVTSQGFVAGWGTLPLGLPRLVCLAIAVALNTAIVSMMLQINKIYNLLRTMTQLHGALYLIFLLSTPILLYSINAGALLCLCVLWCMALMYMVYGTVRCDTRKVFLVFFLLSGCSAFNYAFAIYVPVFILACFQVRVFSLRCAFAIIIGLITPWILFFGFGIITVEQMQLPIESFRLPSLSDRSTALLTCTVLFTSLVAIGALLQNVIKIITYNAQSRSLLSVISTITVITVIFSILDVSNAYTYIPLLNCCAAFQTAHLFLAIHNFSKSYLGVLCIVLIYILLYVWNLTI